MNAASMKYFLIQVGVNDIDHMGGKDVFEEVKKNINSLKTKFPDIKVILAELTPRKNEKDVDVCNQLLREYALSDDQVFLASHENLRANKNDFLVDNKHISRKKIGVFVVNLKRALCQAYGIPYISRAEYEERKKSEGNTDT